MRDVRVVGVGQELNLAGAAERSEVSPVTRYHDGRTDDIAGFICDERREAISVRGKWTLSCAYGDDPQQQGENQNEGSDDDKTVHDDLLHIDSKCGPQPALLNRRDPVHFEVVDNQRTSHRISLINLQHRLFASLSLTYLTLC